MSTATVKPTQEILPNPPTNLPEEDGVPLESDWHRLEMNLLIELVGLHFKGREDYFAGGNMFIYFDARQARGRNFRGPDFFFVWDVPLNPPRKYWAIWDEGGKYPDVIIELTSPTTADEDYGIKKTTYERVFQTKEYIIYDPIERDLQGWRLNGDGRYRKIQPDEEGRIWLKKLGLWLGLWQGKFQGKKEEYLRFFDKDGNLIPSAEEIAEAEKQRADAEKQRADAAEAELASLKSQRKKPAS